MNDFLYTLLEKQINFSKDSSLLGFSSIPWEEITQILASHWDLKTFSIKAKGSQILPEDKLLSGFSENFYLVSFHFTPLLGEVFWVMDHQDLAKLCGEFLIKEGTTKKITSEILQESFYHFLLAQGLEEVSKHEFFQSFSPKIVSRAHLPEKPSLGIDISIKLPSSTIWGRVIVTSEFKDSWNQYLSKNFPKEKIPLENQTQKVPLSLCLSTLHLSKEEWQDIKVGDFLLLEESSYDPNFHSGKGLLFLENYPIFEVEFAENELQLLETTPSLEKNEEALLSVQVELQQVTLPLQSLLMAKSGDVFPLPSSKNLVQLKIQGKIKAEGELIYLGNQLGVYIKKLPSAKAKEKQKS